MLKSKLDRAVRDATGESLRTIRQRGFSLADPAKVRFDPEPPIARDPQIVDWDEADQQRMSLFP